jgi:hypothetical protein
MRTFVFFAVLALAASAFDLQEYVQGFNQQMNFTDVQLQHEYTCFVGLNQIFGGLRAKFLTKDMVGLVQAAHQVKPQIQQYCGDMAMDFFMYAFQHGTNEDPKQIMNKYFPQLVQQVATWVHYLVAGQDFQAGQTEAYILQVLMGAQKPEVLPMPQFDWNKLQQFNPDAFFQQYLGAFFDTLGLAQQVDITAIPQCIAGLQVAFQNATAIERQFYRGDFDAKLDAVQAFIGQLIQGTKACKGALKIEATLIIPVYKAFARDPVTFLLKALDNTATNFPEIIQNIMQERVDLAEGAYAEAGTLRAQRTQTVLKGLVDYAN